MSKSWTLRLPEELFTRLREEHAQSYPEHRLSFNRWLVGVIEAAVAMSRVNSSGSGSTGSFGPGMSSPRSMPPGPRQQE